jgi:hypothetical protein
MNCLLILGDNVYSNKNVYSKEEIERLGLKPKNHSVNTLTNGIECLLRQDDLELYKDTHIVLGNHNIVKNKKGNACAVYKLQKNIHSLSRHLHSQYPYNSIIINEHGIRLKLIFIDTNFTDLGLDYLGDSCIANNSENLTKLQRQLSWLNDELDNTNGADHVIVIGHCPIFSNKYKDNKQGYKVTKIDELIKTLGSRMEKENIIYLCADTHMYQLLKMSNPTSKASLFEIVCGTGEAKLDPRAEIKGNSRESFEMEYNGYLFKKDHEIDYTYGYCKIHLFKKKISVNFIEIMKDTH